MKNKCEKCSRDFCSKAELYVHKQLNACELPAADQNNSIVRLDVDDSIKIEFNESTTKNYNQNKQQTGIESSSRMENRMDQSLNQPVTMQGKSSSSYKCDICGRILSKNSNMKEHLMIHNDERPFECWLCHTKWVKFL